MTTMNPFLVQSTLPYLAPHFDQIANHHYRPAFDEGMQQKRAEIAAIALNPQMPDFNNTILALEQSGELLTRVTSVFFAMTAAHTNDELQRLDEQFSAELAELANDIYLNGELFARVDAVWQRRESHDGASVSLRGNLISHKGEDRYVFRDKSGEINVVIPAAVFDGREVQPDQMINISGSLDKKSAPAVVRVMLPTY